MKNKPAVIILVIQDFYALRYLHFYFQRLTWCESHLRNSYRRSDAVSESLSDLEKVCNSITKKEKLYINEWETNISTREKYHLLVKQTNFLLLLLVLLLLCFTVTFSIQQLLIWWQNVNEQSVSFIYDNSNWKMHKKPHFTD